MAAAGRESIHRYSSRGGAHFSETGAPSGRLHDAFVVGLHGHSAERFDPQSRLMENAAKTEARSMGFSPAKLIDLARYPIIDLSTDEARTLTHHCRAQLDATGACELPGFLTPEAVELLTREDVYWPRAENARGQYTS